jgi:hypothetical protein
MRMVAALVCLVALSQVSAYSDSGCIRLDKANSGIHLLHGRLTRAKPRVSYCFYALAGQHMLINIKPSGDLNTQGYLRFAGTPAKSDWAPGSPGGIVFNETLPWAGKYWLIVGQRFSEWKVGSFKIEISTD